MKLLVALAFLLAGQAADHDGYQPAEWIVDPRILSCPSSTLSATDKIDLDLGPHHGEELAIRRVSDDTWHFLVVGSPDEAWPQLMSPAEFAKARQVRIPATFQVRSANGSLVPVLYRSGQYEAYVSDNLESEVGGYVCRFHFVGVSGHVEVEWVPVDPQEFSNCLE